LIGLRLMDQNWSQPLTLKVTLTTQRSPPVSLDLGRIHDHALDALGKGSPVARLFRNG
jgi:hypothetical protein